MEQSLREKIIVQLRNAGISPLESRIAVLGYLAEHRIHPTAETIFHALTAQYPTLSLTTVYNTLKTLVQKHQILSLNIDDAEVHYDYDTTRHAHFRCRDCGHIVDLMVLTPPGLNDEAMNVTIDEIQVDCYGLCRKCAQLAKN